MGTDWTKARLKNSRVKTKSCGSVSKIRNSNSKWFRRLGPSSFTAYNTRLSRTLVPLPEYGTSWQVWYIQHFGVSSAIQASTSWIRPMAFWSMLARHRHIYTETPLLQLPFESLEEESKPSLASFMPLQSRRYCQVQLSAWGGYLHLSLYVVVS